MTHAEIERITDRIVELAWRRGYSQEQLEAAADVPRNRISKWKSRKSKRPEIQVTYLHRIARLLGVPMDYFLEDTPVDALLRTDMDYVIYLAKKLGPDESLRRLMAIPDRPAVDEPAAPKTLSGRSPNPPVNPPGRRRDGKTA